ncbi:MerR family transcriptional regulator [Propionibacteriaceae bacterium Y1685]
MQMSELAAESGVPVPTIKFYLREGLLSAGRRISATRASYDQRHVRRLRLIRALVDSAELSLERVRTVIAAVDDPPDDLLDLLGTVTGDGGARATPRADAVAAQQGWTLPPGCPQLGELEDALTAVESSGFVPPEEIVPLMCRVADELAEAEVAGIPQDSAEAATEYVLVGSTLMGPVLLALRSLGHVHHSLGRFGSQEDS